MHSVGIQCTKFGTIVVKRPLCTTAYCKYKENLIKMSAFRRELFLCFACLFVVSLCVTYVQPFVLDGKSDAANKHSDLLKIIPSDNDNVLTQNGLNSNGLQETDGK